MSGNNETSNPELNSEHQPPWFENKNLLIAWLLVFFPIGLYGLWKGEVFAKNYKIGITIGIVVLFVGGLFKFNTPIYPFILFPVALFLVFKAPDLSRATLYKFGAGWIVVVLLYVANASVGGSGFDDQYFADDCSATFTQNGCTYYRDGQCQVIAKDCG